MKASESVSNHRLPTEAAEQFAAVTLRNVIREFPNKLDHVMNGPADIKGPRELHPIFFGCFDWHSCVHGYWQLARLRRLVPGLSQAAEIDERFNAAFTVENIASETSYMRKPQNRLFERPYGWAWLLMLCDELSLQQHEHGGAWHLVLMPLAELIVDRFLEFLPLCTYPIRTGAHSSTAFAITLALSFSRSHGHHVLEAMLQSKERDWYGNDAHCLAWEPSQDDFLSPALIEALCMSRVLPASDFQGWFARFLPHIADRQPVTLFQPATVSDRTDGKIAHLDGLNLSRAWCFRSIAKVLQGEVVPVLTRAAEDHLAASLGQIFGDYAGEHWLATFALLALTDS